jgi:hypothetical protein
VWGSLREDTSLAKKRGKGTCPWPRAARRPQSRGARGGTPSLGLGLPSVPVLLSGYPIDVAEPSLLTAVMGWRRRMTDSYWRSHAH